MITYHNKQFKSFDDLQPNEIDFRYFEGVLNYIYRQTKDVIIDITKFQNKELFIVYCMYYIDWTYYSLYLPKIEFNQDFSKIKIIPYQEPKKPITR